MREFQVTDRTLFKGTSAVVVKHQRKATDAKALKDAYAVVNARDENRDRVTGKPLKASSADPAVRREHHHIQSRGAYPERIADPANIILVSVLTHSLIEGGLIVVEGIDASLPNRLRFMWRVDPPVPANLRVVRIQSRRRTEAA